MLFECCDVANTLGGTTILLFLFFSADNLHSSATYSGMTLDDEQSKRCNSCKSCSRVSVPINVHLSVTFVLGTNHNYTFLLRDQVYNSWHFRVTTKSNCLIGHSAALSRYSSHEVQPVELSARDQWTPVLYVEPVSRPKNLHSDACMQVFWTRKPQIWAYARLHRLFIDSGCLKLMWTQL